MSMQLCIKCVKYMSLLRYKRIILESVCLEEVIRILAYCHVYGLSKTRVWIY
jgi:hypothetical protein